MLAVDEVEQQASPSNQEGAATHSDLDSLVAAAERNAARLDWALLRTPLAPTRGDV